jgi:toxin YoeB
MPDLIFHNDAWAEYLWWQTQDKRTLRKIHQLIRDALRDPSSGLGQPEPLKFRKSAWSRRIDGKNRLVYEQTETGIIVTQCRGHYDDR